MAILSKKTEEVVDQTKPEVTAEKVLPAPLLGASSGILIQPRISEKSVKLSQKNQYVFKVKPHVNKIQVRKAVEKFYGVKVERVNMIRTPGKTRRAGVISGRTSGTKKAIVTLKSDSKKLEIFE